MAARELPKRYQRKSPVSYTLGPFPTFELLAHRPQAVRAVYYDERFREVEKLAALCGEVGVPCLCSPKALARLAQKEALYAAAEFEKYPGVLGQDRPHVALVDPADMGNLGTIQRTMLAFGLRDLAVIGQTPADYWHPKAVRASMGAVFQLEVARFPDFAAYREKYGAGREMFPFMLDGATALTLENCPDAPRYTLVFGNEATGLPPEAQAWGKSLFIPQSAAVDSLNLAVSAAIGVFLFTQRNGGAG